MCNYVITMVPVLTVIKCSHKVILCSFVLDCIRSFNLGIYNIVAGAPAGR